jgi:RNA polymerase sigma-70 factor (sigma-E family)
MGDEREFASFVRANTSALLRTAFLLTGNALTAEELVQDTLVRLYPKWHRVAAADIPLAYVRRAVANAFVNDRRRAHSRDVVLDVLPERPYSYDGASVLADRDEAWGLLAAVSERQRAALVLRYFHDWTDAEIAEALDCRTGTVRSLISRGLATLRQQLTAADSSTEGRPS